MKLRAFLPLLFALPLAAQTPTMTLYPATAPGIPVKVFKTFSVHVEGVPNKTVTWSVSGGANLVGNINCPEAQTEDCTIAVYDVTPGTYTITATSNANHTTTATGTVTFVAAPTPLTTHPREILNSSNLAAFQAYMASGAAIPNELIAMATSYAASDDVSFSTGGGGGGYNGGNNAASCPGGGGGTGLPNATYLSNMYAWNNSPELAAEVYALMALGDPTTANRPAWACRAHDSYILIMRDILNNIPGTPCPSCDSYGNPHLGLGNRGSVWSVGVGLALDWDYSSFTSSDFSTYIVPALTLFIKDANTNVGTIATSTPVPLGVQNDPSIFQATASANSYGYMRSFANNYGDYYTNFEIAIGVAMDPADDPSSAHCAGGALATCSDGTPNSLRAAYNYGLGAWMYAQAANLEDPAVTVGEYNQVFGSHLTVNDQCNSNGFGNPTPRTATMPCYGNGRGGLSHEGNILYGGWLMHFLFAAQILQSSGYIDPVTYPQVSFLYSSSWDAEDNGLLHMTTPAIYSPSQSYQLMWANGPTNASYDQANFIATVPMAHYGLSNLQGRTDNLNTDGWLAGNLNIQSTLTSNMANWIPGAIQLTLDQIPGSSPFSTFTDPRPTMPSAYVSYNSGQLMTSTGGWNATTGAVYHRYCPRFPQPNHEEGYCGTFDLYVDGDWVVDDISSYAFNDGTGYWGGETPESGNMMALGNNPSVLPNPTQQNEGILDTLMNRGGQSNNGYETGQNGNSYWSDNASYTYDQLDSTGGRNSYGPNPGLGSVSLQDVTGATSEYLWIKPHFLVAMDRGDISSASFMRRFFTIPSSATISGTTVSWSSALNKTSDYLHVLLQPNANIGVYPLYPFSTTVAANYYPFTAGHSIAIDSGAINHVTNEAHSTLNCGLSGATNTVCPTNRVNVIRDLGVTGGSGCVGNLTQVSDLTTPGSCQYAVTSDYRYILFPADLAAGVQLHYDWSTPASSTRWLNVVEAQNFGTGSTTVTHVSSSAGTGYDCANISGVAMVCFATDLGSFTGVTYPASSATTHYVTDLAPFTTYTISGAGAPTSATTDEAGVLTFAATGTGNIVLGPGGAPAAPTNLQGTFVGTFQ